MNKLRLSIATGPYDRNRPMVDGEVTIDGVDPVFMLLTPEEMFFRSFRHQAFDVSELSLSSFSVKTVAGDNPYVGIPVFPSRAFRHTAICVRSDRIKTPADLKGKRVGIPEYQLTANVWARGILEEHYGVKSSEMHWVRGGLEETGRTEKIALKLPEGIKIEAAPADRTLSQMLEAGEIDAIVAPRAPSCFERGDPNVGWLWPDMVKEASDFYRKTKIFPIMHVMGVRRELAEQHPWLPMAIFKAFSASKKRALELLIDTSATKVMLPFIEETLRATKQLMGDDYWPYGLAPNHHVLDTFLGYHHAQGLSSRRLRPEELFHPSTLEAYKI